MERDRNKLKMLAVKKKMDAQKAEDSPHLRTNLQNDVLSIEGFE